MESTSQNNPLALEQSSESHVQALPFSTDLSVLTHAGICLHVPVEDLQYKPVEAVHTLLSPQVQDIAFIFVPAVFRQSARKHFCDVDTSQYKPLVLEQSCEPQVQAFGLLAVLSVLPHTG